MPLKFYCFNWFKNLIIENRIEKLIQDEFLNFQEEYHIEDIRKDSETSRQTISVKGVNEMGKTIEETYSDFDLIKYQVYINFIKTKDCINNLWFESNDKNAILKIQTKFLSEIFKEGEDQLSKFPEVTHYLNELVDHIEFLSDSGKLEIKKFEIPLKTNNDLVYQVLGYLQGENEKQQKIMNDDDFHLLIQWTYYLIKKNEVPEISKKLNLNITAELLRFSYYVLHKELFTTKKIKMEFIDFLHEVFPHFDNYEKSSTKSAFHRHSNLNREEFIPEIIRKNFK